MQRLRERCTLGLRRATQAARETPVANRSSVIESRWPEVFDWIGRITSSWVQRRKSMTITRSEEGIAIAMQTQDDLGYYDYAFDMIADRARRRMTAKRVLARLLPAGL